MHEIPGLEQSLLPFHDQQDLTCEHEKVLLCLLAVVHAVRFAGPKDADADTELGKANGLALECRIEPEPFALEPLRVARVDDEPALSGRREPRIGLLERSFRNHDL